MNQQNPGPPPGPPPPAQPSLDALSANLSFFLLGIFGWEYLQSLQVEFALIYGRTAFRPSVIPYILGRACLFVFLVLVAIATSPFPRSVSCLPSTLTIALLGDVALGSSSMNFLIRTWLIWKDSRLIHAMLLFLALGQWTILLVDVANIRAKDMGCFCDVYLVHPQIDAAALIYTTCFDLLVFVLSVIGLLNQQSETPLTRRLRAQGMLYIAVAGIGYIPPVVSVMLDKHSVYLLVSNAAITLSTIVASRAVRSLYLPDRYYPDSGTLQSDIALTTHIGVQRTMLHEDIPSGPPCVDEVDRR